MIDFKERLQRLIHDGIEEDVGDGDHSTLSCIPEDETGEAVLKIKDVGVLAGVAVAEAILRQLEPECVFEQYKKDGDQMLFGEVAFRVKAHVHTILKAERLLLNCMQRMSGIATLTREYVTLLEGYHTRILDTRKTTPNFRLLEKEAVKIGGGVNHRFGLFDMIMLKDNHIDYCGGIEPAVERAHAYAIKHGNLKIEVETRSIADVETLIRMGEGKVFRIMLDNFSPDQVHEAMQLINHRFETEASGGITLTNLVEYAKTGVDYVSAGALIHQARSLDLSFKAVKPSYE